MQHYKMLFIHRKSNGKHKNKAYISQLKVEFFFLKTDYESAIAHTFYQ
jgi:hypothetical protein